MAKAAEKARCPQCGHTGASVVTTEKAIRTRCLVCGREVVRDTPKPEEG